MLSAFDEISLNHEDGDITLEHSVLALDAKTFGQINFLSNVAEAYFSGKTGGKQLLVSPEAHRILAGKMTKAAFLPCTYFRPIMIGNLRVELLPSGHGTGSAFLRIDKKGDSLLYASHWSNRASTLLRRAAPKPSDTLLLKLHCDPSTLFATSVRREMELFTEFCVKLTRAGEKIVAVVDSWGTAHHLIASLTELRVPIGIDKHLQALLDIAQELNNPTAHSGDAPRIETPGVKWTQGAKTQWVEMGAAQPCVVFVSKEALLARKQRSLPQGIWVWTGLDHQLCAQSQWISQLTFAEKFAIQFFPDHSEIEELVHETCPRQVLVCGEGARTCVHQLTRKGIDAQVFAPPRLETLF
jgi:hypothetical protein